MCKEITLWENEYKNAVSLPNFIKVQNFVINFPKMTLSGEKTVAFSGNKLASNVRLKKKNKSKIEIIELSKGKKKHLYLNNAFLSYFYLWFQQCVKIEHILFSVVDFQTS